MNPFSSCNVRSDHNEYRFAISDEQHAHARECLLRDVSECLKSKQRIAIVGPHGTGKSTLLSNLRPMLESQFGYIQWLKLTHEPQQTRHTIASCWQQFRSSAKSMPSCWVIDGYEQLAWHQRWRLVHHLRRNDVCLVVTSHREHCGFRTVQRTAWDPALAHYLTLEKLASASPMMQTRLQACLRQRLSDSRNQVPNLRELWFLMYDDAERIRRESSLQPSANVPACNACSP